MSFALHLRAAGALPVKQRAPGALRLGLLQTLQSFERYEPEESAVVVALMVREELFKNLRGATLRQALVTKGENTFSPFVLINTLKCRNHDL